MIKKAFIQLHVAVFIAGFTAILGKWIQLHEAWLVIYRLFFSVIVIAGWITFQKQWNRVPSNELFKIAGVGFILALHWLTFYAAVKYGSASVAVVCIAASGFFSALLEPFFFKVRIQWMDLALGFVSLVGIGVLFNFHPQHRIGIAFGLFSAFGSALFPIFNKRLLEKTEPVLLTFYEFLGGGMLLLLLMPIYGMLFPATHYWPIATDWLWLMLLVLVCTVWAFKLQLDALKHLSPFTVNLMYNLEPVYGVALAFFLLNETHLFNWQFYIGLLLVLCSMGVQLWRVVRRNIISQSIDKISV
ncbi:MAG: DMT family transporter [Ferruginibacter sp.]